MTLGQEEVEEQELEVVQESDVDIKLEEEEERGVQGEDLAQEVGSPITWNMKPYKDEFGSNHVPLHGVDDCCGEHVVGMGSMVTMVLSILCYLLDTTFTFIGIGYFFTECSTLVGLVPLLIAAASDCAMFLFGKLLGSQSVFMWPMNLKCCLLFPAYEIQWLLRAIMEWRAHQSDEATVTKHYPRFLHAFGAMLCVVRVFIFTVPQMIYLIVARVRIQDTRGPYENVPSSTMFYTIIGVHCLFCFMTILISIQACTKASAATASISRFGTPKLHPSSSPLACWVAVLLVVGIYTAAVLLSALIETADC